MMRLPVTNDASQRFGIVLGNARFDVALHWNPLTEHWYTDISAGGASLVLGRRVIADERLIPFAQLGTIAAVSTNGSVGDPGRTAWGDTHDLYWLSPSEVDAL